MIRKALIFVLSFLLLLALAACSASEPEEIVYGEGEEFALGDDSYALKEIVALSEYSTEATVGYGVVFLKKTAQAPISMSMSGGSQSTVSLIDMSLAYGEDTLPSENISFIATDENPGYKAAVTMVFQMARADEFPKSGTFSYTKQGEEESAKIDLSGLTVPENTISQTPAVDGDYGTLQFEGKDYTVAIGETGLDDEGQTTVEIVGNEIGKTLPFRNGEMTTPLMAEIIAGGETAQAISYTVNPSSFIFTFDTGETPEKIVLYGNDGAEPRSEIAFDGNTKKII